MATLPLHDIPPDVKGHILDMQTDLKKKKNFRQVSLPTTIFHIIREHKRLTEKIK